MLAPIIRTIQRFPVHTDLLDGTVISIENANLSLKWESSSRKLRDTTEKETNMAYVMSIERLAREEGWAEGREEGREEGRQEGEKRGEAKALRRLVQVKFGPPGPAVEARIQGAEPAQLERWLERILTAKNLDELFG
jgi:flagellar biosynthesis/type III secretory pathway protein FliH